MNDGLVSHPGPVLLVGGGKSDPDQLRELLDTCALRVAADGKALSLWWSAPERGGRVKHYIAEGLVKGGWQPIAEFKGSRHRGDISASETEGVEAWRLRASNGAGQSEPSVEAGPPDND
mgnify:CR=1 FL=1